MSSIGIRLDEVCICEYVIQMLFSCMTLSLVLGEGGNALSIRLLVVIRIMIIE